LFFGPTPSASGKTSVWAVTAAAGADLGKVRWFGRWRRYVFLPAAGTVYDASCLRILAEFCDGHTRSHRAGKRP
jgi:hypothetical protein